MDAFACCWCGIRHTPHDGDSLLKTCLTPTTQPEESVPTPNEILSVWSLSVKQGSCYLMYCPHVPHLGHTQWNLSIHIVFTPQTCCKHVFFFHLVFMTKAKKAPWFLQIFFFLNLCLLFNFISFTATNCPYCLYITALCSLQKYVLVQKFHMVPFIETKKRLP